MPVAQIDAYTGVEYLVFGEPKEGRADLVLIHGTGGTAQSNWGHLVEAMREGRRAIIPNLAGSGNTTDHGGQLELSELVAQVAGAAEHAGSARYDVVGFSLGAVVAAELAATHPERVRRLVPIAGWATSHDGRAPLQFDLWLGLQETNPRALAQLLTLTGFSAPFLAKRPIAVVQRMVDETLETLPPGIGRQAELDRRIDITASLGRIEASTLVIGCRQDQMVPVQAPRGLVAPIRWSDYAEIDSGHLVIFEQPDELTETITGFLGRPERRRVGQPFDGPDRREYR